MSDWNFLEGLEIQGPGVLRLGARGKLHDSKLTNLYLEIPDGAEVLVVNSDLYQCDLRKATWGAFISCRFFDCQLPEIGQPENFNHVMSEEQA